MKILLNVPFEERFDAKGRGAKWDIARRKWYVENMEDLTPFMKWMDGHLKVPSGFEPEPAKAKEPRKPRKPRPARTTRTIQPESAMWNEPTPPWEGPEYPWRTEEVPV